MEICFFNIGTFYKERNNVNNSVIQGKFRQVVQVRQVAAQRAAQVVQVHHRV